jgi:hypothetical protein
LLGAPKIGRALGNGISRIFGKGDYLMNSPAKNTLMTGGGPPAFSPLTSGFTVRHREYIQDIQSSIGFNSVTFSLNPGLQGLFPWLSQVASNFEEYIIKGMVVYLNSTSATAVSSTNTALGVWGVVTQYEASEPPFTTKQQCENYVGCQSTVPCNSLIHGIECKPKANVLDRMYIRTGDLSNDQDIKFYDWGKVQVFTQGSQAVSTIGEMWVSYDIEFLKPRLPTGGYVAESDYLTFTSNASSCFGLANPVNPLPGSTIGTYIDSLNKQIIFPANITLPGYYMIECKWVHSTNTTTVLQPNCTYSGSVSGINYFVSSSTGVPFSFNNVVIPPNGTLAQSSAEYATVVYKSDIGQGAVTFVNNVVAATMFGTVTITRLSPSIFNPPVSKKLPFSEKDIEVLKIMLNDYNNGRDDRSLDQFIVNYKYDEN